MSRQGIGLIISSVLACGILLEIRNEFNNNDTLMNWYEAHRYCQSLSSNLVDPHEDKIFTNVTFWTNRHLDNYSSWIYIKGCVKTSSSINGRLVSSVWQCDNLCNLSRFFGIQNSSCICLDADDNDAKNAEKRLCTEVCSTVKSPFKYCGKSGLITVYGKLKVDVINPHDSNCLALTCNSGTKGVLNPSVCDNKYYCACSDGGNYTLRTGITTRNWTDCFQYCENEKKRFISTTHCNEIYHPPLSQLAWIGVARNPNVDTGLNTTESPHCYSCVNTSFECQYQSCLQKHFPLCQQINIEIDATYEVKQRMYSTRVSIGYSGNFNLTDRKNSTNKTVTMHNIHHGTTSLNKVMTTTSSISHNTESQDNSLETIIPVTVSCVSVLIVCAVVLIVYRYKRRKAFTSNRQEMVHFQNEYAEAFRSNMAARIELSDHSINEKHKESSFKHSQMEVYDHLGENHERNFNEESENEYSHCRPRDTQYGEVTHTPFSDTYDHAKCTSVNDSEYSTCSR